MEYINRSPNTSVFCLVRTKGYLPGRSPFRSHRRRQQRSATGTSENANLAAGNRNCCRRTLAGPARAPPDPDDTRPGGTCLPHTVPPQACSRGRPRGVDRTPEGKCPLGIVLHRGRVLDTAGLGSRRVVADRPHTCPRDSSPSCRRLAGRDRRDRCPSDTLPDPDTAPRGVRLL